jgi:general nucleoside transport system permease protein
MGDSHTARSATIRSATLRFASMRSAAVARSLAALIIAAAIISIVLIALSASPAAVFADLCQGAFGNWLAFTDTIVKSTPLLFTGLAIAIAFQGALWNIGADGQLVVGALAAGAIGPAVGGWPHPIAILAMITAGAVGGALWGGFAGWLRARREVNEVISTIMLNFVAAQVLSWAVHGPLMEPSRSFPKSVVIAPSAQLVFYLEPSRLNSGMVLALIFAVACHLALFHSAPGFELRALGRNRRASAFFGIPIRLLTVGAMALSGALAGVGGAVQVSAITHRLYETMSPGWGYEAIAVALVARLNPLAIVPAAILFGALDNGSQAMQRADAVSPVLVNVIQGMVIIILIAFDATAARGMRTAFFGGDGAATASGGAAEEVGNA